MSFQFGTAASGQDITRKPGLARAAYHAALPIPNPVLNGAKGSTQHLSTKSALRLETGKAPLQAGYSSAHASEQPASVKD